jgi:hypothetical protein
MTPLAQQHLGIAYGQGRRGSRPGISTASCASEGLSSQEPWDDEWEEA